MSIQRLSKHSPTPLSILKAKFFRKSFSSIQYPIDYEFIQRSQVPTMHFQRSLPRLPIPKLDLTCERYLAAQKPLLIEEAYRKTENNVNQFRTTDGKQLQHLLKNYDRQNKHTSYINELWFDNYLSDRRPIPINSNPMLVMQNDLRTGYNDQLIRSTNLVISSIRFYKSLRHGYLEPEVFHLNPKRSDTKMFRNVCSSLPDWLSWYGAYMFKAYPLDMSQHSSLFNSTRIPETDKDRLVKNLPGNHITVQHKGHFYVFSVLDKYGEILKAEKILARLKFIFEDDVEKNQFPIGVLTTMERNQWATIRHELAENGNETNLKLIDSALFNLCLDDVYLDGDVYDTIRNFLHGDGENRWFDKSFSIQISKDGVAAVNFEHSWGDGVAVLRYVQDVYKDSIENPFVHPDTPPYDDDINNVVRLDTLYYEDYNLGCRMLQGDAFLLLSLEGKHVSIAHWSIASRRTVINPLEKDFQDNEKRFGAFESLNMKLNDNLKCCIQEAKKEYIKYCKALDIDYLVFDRVGKNICKKQAVSPDAIMQLGFQVGYHKMTGKFVPTYESCSTAAFKHGRTEVVRSCTSLTKAFTLAINSNYKPSINELKMMIGDCSRHHNQLTREAAMGQGFDRHLFALKKLAEKTNLFCNIFDDPHYTYLNHIILSTSTLSSPAIYAGGFGPVERDGLGVAYIIRDDELGVLVTSYPPYQDGSDFIDALRETFAEMVLILDTD